MKKRNGTILALGLASLALSVAATATSISLGEKAESVNAEGKTIILDAKSFGLTSAATEVETTKTFDGVNYVLSKGAKTQASSGTKRFSKNPAILIGTSGTYIYNSIPFETEIAKFEIFANKGASAKVSVQVDFSSDPLESKKATGDWTQTLSTLDNVYTINSVPAGSKYFRYSVTNANNSQVQFRITLAEGVADTLTGITAELKDDSKVWLDGETVTIDDINVYAVYSVSGAVLVTDDITIENGLLSAGENAVTISYAGQSYDLAVTAAARTVESVEVVGDMENKSYSIGADWNLSGLSLDVAYNAGEPISVPFSDSRVVYTIDPAKASSTSTTSITISGTFEESPFTKTIEGIAVHEPVYSLVSDEAKLYSGMKFHITADAGAYAAGKLSNSVLQKADFDPHADAIVAAATQFELQGTAGNWNIVSDQGNLESTAAKKMSYVATDAPWNITIDEDGKATILKNSTIGKILYNKSTPRFTTYTSSPSSSMLLPEIYAIAETDPVLAFIRDNLRMGDTAMTGEGSGACVTENYYATAKAALSKLTAEERLSFQNDTDRKYSAALARYLAWASAAGDLTPFDGMPTFESKSANYFGEKETASSSSSAIAAIACGLGLVSAASLLLLRRKKQDRE